MPREPQSYGSQGDWVSGKVDEEVNRQKDVPSSHPHFYENRRDSEGSGSDQGGKVSPFQAGESAGWYPQASEIDYEPVQKVSARKKGAKRGSFFRDRDYRR
jgi:hypothetical protein